jgi:HSP20 family molecular chaperone IbpA
LRLTEKGPYEGEVADLEHCRKADDGAMPWLKVDLDENTGFVYAMASVPGCKGQDVSIGLEPEWLAILAQRDVRPPQEAGGAENGAPEQTFCVMSLPAEVNPVDAIAVLAKGVLAIRMRKASGLQECRR